LLAKTLLKAGAAGVKLFPAGEAHIEKQTVVTMEDEGTPDTNNSDLRRCRIVIKNGAIFDRAKLYAAKGILPAK
jgi:hypothetical protein